MTAYEIMIVEDDEKIAQSVADYLQEYGYNPIRVTDFRQVEHTFLKHRPHLVLMDVTLPYQDGFHLTRLIRRHSAVPVLFVSSRAGEMEQLMGIESGGDDYIVKPFQLEILHAKVRAMLRRAYGEYAQVEAKARTTLVVRGLQLDLTAGELRFGGQTQVLSRNELKLLCLLLERQGQVVSRGDCLEAIWDEDTFVDDNTLTVNMARLRSKLEAVGLPDLIQTRRGLGYQLHVEQLGETP